MQPAIPSAGLVGRACPDLDSQRGRGYGGTFLTFFDYMRGAVRLAALMHLPVTYVWTRDSIGLGEDGPAHQQVLPHEKLAELPQAGVAVWLDDRSATASAAATCSELGASPAARTRRAGTRHHQVLFRQHRLRARHARRAG